MLSIRRHTLHGSAALGAQDRNARPIANPSSVKVFSKKCGASDQQETQDEQYWHPQTNMIIGASK